MSRVADTPDARVRAARRRTLALLDLQRPAPDVAGSADIQVVQPTAPAVTVRLFHPRGAGDVMPAFVLLHGGGWVAGDLTSHDRVARRLATATSSVVALVDYRRAPEHPYPAGLDDAVAVTSWLLRHGRCHGVDPSRVVVVGDSAGGNLAAATCLRLREAGARMPLAQVLLYPVLAPPRAEAWPTPAGETYPTYDAMRWYWEQYTGGSTPDRFAAPLRSVSLAGLPPALVYVGGADPVRRDGERYVARLQADRVAALLRTCAGAPHAFMMMDAVEPAADRVLSDLPDDLARLVGSRSPDQTPPTQVVEDPHEHLPASPNERKPARSAVESSVVAS